MKIEMDEKSVFTCCPETLSIHIHTHQEGIFKGDLIETGRIQFASSQQARHFAEMIYLMMEKL